MVISRSDVRSSGRRSPRMAPATVSAMSCVVSPSCEARSRFTTTCTSCSPVPASERTASSPEIDDRRCATSREMPARRSVDSPASCRLNDVEPLMLSSKVKLGLPMMISGMSAITRSMTTVAGTRASSFAVR
jgi:hypothetical protein